MNDGEITFTMRLDPQQLGDLARMIGGGLPGAPGGAAAGGPAPSAAAANASVTGSGQPGAQGQGSPQSNPSFWSIFKPLAALSVIEKVLGGILRHSQITSTYMGAMGKMFGAAIDMLLVPFIPLFNLIMVGMSKLISWLITSGALEKIQAVMERVAKNIESIVNWAGQVYKAVKDMDFGKLAGLVVQGVGAAVKESLSNPLAAIATGLTVLAGATMANRMLGGLPGKVLTGWGGGGTKPPTTVASPKGGGGGILGAVKAIPMLATMYGATKLGDSLFGKPEKDMNGYYERTGLGNIGLDFNDMGLGLPSWLTGRKRVDGPQGQSSSGPVNSGNTVNVTMNLAEVRDPRLVADETMKEIQRKLGFQMGLRN